MPRVSATFVVFVSLVLGSGTGTRADDPNSDYLQQVKPLLAEKCFACHGALRQESGLRLDAARLIQQGGDGGAVVVAGQASDSELIKRVAAEDEAERMPPAGEGKRLTEQQISLLRRWIDQGAAMPDESIPFDPRQHWAFQRPQRRPIPRRTEPWVRNQVDALLAAGHEAHGLTPAPAAPKQVLLRRVYLDLVGLSPTRAELQAFLADSSPDAYERVVERLLASPQYGERWGRHWMDVWRYSDWTGFGDEIRYGQRHLWRWREWIVESLNADKGYDHMILEMLAADELLPDDTRAIRATGFLARSWYKFDRHVWLDDVIEHTGKAFLGMTFKCAKCHDHKYDPISQEDFYRLRAIFEPYDVRTDQVPGELDLNRDGLARVYDARGDAATFVFEHGDPKRADQNRPAAPGVPAVLGGQLTVEPVELPIASYYPAMREFVAQAMIAQAEAAVAAAKGQSSGQSLDQSSDQSSAQSSAQSSGQSSGQSSDQSSDQSLADKKLADKKLATAQAQLVAVTARVAAEREKYRTASGASRTDVPAYGLLARAAVDAERAAAIALAEENLLTADQLLERARRGGQSTDEATAQQALEPALQKVAEAQKQLSELQRSSEQDTTSCTPLGPLYPSISTGRRLALARWIVDRRNPLTARIAANHIWLRHVGRPLVSSVDDFGLRAPRPPLVGLLDYLAAELMDGDWSMKQLHRLIVTSGAYRMSSSVDPQVNPSAKIDPDNQMFWRMNPRRMEAETVRDVVLYVARNLDLSRGGPDIDHTQGLAIPRRSLYFRHARERQMEFLMIFDAADPRECYRRQPSIRPHQALALVNSSLSLAQSRSLAGQISRNQAAITAAEPGGKIDDAAFVVTAFEILLSREPSELELQACRQFLVRQSRQLADPASLELLGTGEELVPPSLDPAERARENLVLVLMNHNDFLTIR